MSPSRWRLAGNGPRFRLLGLQLPAGVVEDDFHRRVGQQRLRIGAVEGLGFQLAAVGRRIDLLDRSRRALGAVELGQHGAFDESERAQSGTLARD